MSWSQAIPAAPAADMLDAIEAFIAPEGVEPTPEVEQQITAAKEAARSLIQSGAIGELAGEGAIAIGVNLSGHANTGHQPAQGYANDTISVTVTQAAVAAPPVEAGEQASGPVAGGPGVPDPVQAPDPEAAGADTPAPADPPPADPATPPADAAGAPPAPDPAQGGVTETPEEEAAEEAAEGAEGTEPPAEGSAGAPA